MYESIDTIKNLKDLFKRSHQSWSMWGDTEKYVNTEIANYLTNISTAKSLDENGALDYKTGVDGFIKKYYELLTAHHSRQINCPSWAITGRGGRNMSKYEDKQRSMHEKESELYDFLKRLDPAHAENYKQNREHQEYRREIMPKTYAEKYVIFQSLIEKTRAIEVAVNSKDYNLALHLIVEYEEARAVATVWYEKRGSNRYIKSFVAQKLHYTSAENRGVDLTRFKLLLEVEVTADGWKKLAITQFNNDGITSTGRWCKKLQQNLIGQSYRLKEWSELYDKKEQE